MNHAEYGLSVEYLEYMRSEVAATFGQGPCPGWPLFKLLQLPKVWVMKNEEFDLNSSPEGKDRILPSKLCMFLFSFSALVRSI